MYKTVNQISEDGINEKFIDACKIGDLNTVKELLTSTELKKHADIHYKDDDGFTLACENGHLELVKYFLTNEILKDKIDIHAYNDLGFVLACERGHLNIVKFLLTSSELKECANIYTYNNYVLKEIVKRGHFEILKFLIFSSELKEKISRKKYHICFVEACKQKKYNIIAFFIFDLNFQIKPLMKTIKEYIDIEIKKMFDSKKLNKKLNYTLKCGNTKEDLIKI